MAIVISAFVVMQPAIALSPGVRASADEPPDTDLVDAVSGQRITDSITALSGMWTRAFYTDDCWNASIYIHDELEELGLWVYYQELDVRGSTVRNVVAVLNGSDPAAGQYLFGAHYDSRHKDDANFTSGYLAAPGADDDASGVAAVIELATILRDSPLPNTIKFVAFAAEESGLNGSMYFVQQESAAGVTYNGTVILDMIGYRSGEKNRATIFCDTATNSMSESILSAIDEYSLDLSVTVIAGNEMDASDHASFWQYGYPSLVMTEQTVNGKVINPYYHTSEDIPYHLSVNQTAEITKAVLGSLLLLEHPLDSGQGWLIPAAVGLSMVVAVTIAVVYVYIHRKVEL